MSLASTLHSAQFHRMWSGQRADAYLVASRFLRRHLFSFVVAVAAVGGADFIWQHYSAPSRPGNCSDTHNHTHTHTLAAFAEFNFNAFNMQSLYSANAQCTLQHTLYASDCGRLATHTRTTHTKKHCENIIFFHHNFMWCLMWYIVWWRVLHFIIILISCALCCAHFCACVDLMDVDADVAYECTVHVDRPCPPVYSNALHCAVCVGFSRKISKICSKCSWRCCSPCAAHIAQCSSCLSVVAALRLQPLKFMAQRYRHQLHEALPCEIVNRITIILHTAAAAANCAKFHELLNRKLSLIYLIRTGTSISAHCNMPNNVVSVGHLLRWTAHVLAVIESNCRQMSSLMSFIGGHLFTYLLISWPVRVCY